MPAPAELDGGGAGRRRRGARPGHEGIRDRSESRLPDRIVDGWWGRVVAGHGTTTPVLRRRAGVRLGAEASREGSQTAGETSVLVLPRVGRHRRAGCRGCGYGRGP